MYMGGYLVRERTEFACTWDQTHETKKEGGGGGREEVSVRERDKDRESVFTHLSV